MGQIVGLNAKPKRCNLNQLSQLETPAAGEHILVSSDNSMNAAGQGNFDCYIVGDGTKTAPNLPLLEIKNTNLFDKLNVGELGFRLIFNSYISLSGVITTYNGWSRTDYINVSFFSELKFASTTQSAYNVFYDENKAKISSFTLINGTKTINVPSNACYMILSNSTAAMRATVVSISKYRFATTEEVNNKTAEVIDAVKQGQDANYVRGRIDRYGGFYDDGFADGWYVPTDFIPCKQGDTLVWTGGKQDGTMRICLCLYDENKQFISDAYWTPFAGERTIAITSAYAAAKYVKMSFRLVTDNDDTNTTPLKINGADAFVVQGKIPGITEVDEKATEALTKATEAQEGTHRLSSYFVGCYFSDGSIKTSKMDNWRYAQFKYCPDYIPVKSGDIVVWNFAAYDNASQCLLVYDDTKTMLSGQYWIANDPTTGTRTITMPANAAYIRICFGLTMPDNTPNNTPVIVDGVPYVIDDITLANNARIELLPTDNEHGIIGEVYPEEVAIVENQLSSKLANRFHFIHISDNHGASFGYAQEYLDYSPAKFIINTGDLVSDKFADKDLSTFQTITLATQPIKPVYLALGNHDYSYATSRQDVFDAFIAPTNTHNSTSFDKTYYSIDFSTEKVKCIVLDMNDGWSDSELPNLGPSNELILGKMSMTQINWFAAQLQSAITNNLHVAVFIHTPPTNISRFKREHHFSDTLTLSYARNLSFLASMIDAFISGNTTTFTYNGNEYSFTFAQAGHFVAWFCGHEHGDVCGWLDGHENQFVCVVCRPYADTGKYSGSYDEDKLGVHWNYCTIDTDRKSLSIYRIGQQTTVYGTERVSFKILYL